MFHYRNPFKFSLVTEDAVLNIHNLLLTMQCITISVLFIEMWIVFIGWKNPIHSYLFFACVSTFISNIGYLFEITAASEEAYLTALKLSYVGRVWITFSLFIFAARMCRVKIPKWVTILLALIHIGIYLAVLTIGSNGLYYADYRFIPGPILPRLSHSNGYVHDLLVTLNGLFAGLGMWWLIRRYRSEKSKKTKFRFLMLIMSFGVQILAFVLQITGFFGISQYYDLTMPGALVGTVFMLIGIFGFDLLGTREIARDFVIDRISEGIIAVDNDGRIRYYNEPVARLYPEFDAFFKSHFIPLDTRTVKTPYDIISSVAEAVRSGSTINIDGRIYTPEENELIHKGDRYGKLYVLVDDTEHYRYMEELQQQKDIADNANEAKSRFLASMSHEIRTPINAVLGMDEMILRESNEKNILAYASDIKSAGGTLLSLINDILDLSKVENGKIDIITLQYDLASLINDLVNMIRERAVKKGLKLEVSVDEDIPHILIGDEIRIRQCVMNLLTNAVKYTEKGRVDLKVFYEKKDEGHISLGFTVEDTGIGMKEEDMEKLFSPYKRIEEKRNRAIEGTGLGMSITRQLLQLMGSELKVRSEYGKGSVFTFAIDQEVVEWDRIGDITTRLNNRAEEKYVYHELFHAPDARILVVDDTEMNLTVIINLLKKTRIRIDTALSGAEAVRLSADNAYDALFIDHMMPDMDGIETLKRIRESGMSKDSPAVALTANAVSGAREMYLEAGFTDYLSKPVNGEKLERLLMHLLPGEKFEMQDITAENGDEAGDAPPSGYLPGGKGKKDPLLEHLQTIEEIDAQTGLENCGSEEGYESVLSVFHQTAKTKAEEIGKLLNNSDIENYTIKVHALKSSARIIGASQLSKLAAELENAGKNKNITFIENNTDRLLLMYRTLDGKLSWLDRTGQDLPSIDSEALKEAYQTAAEIAGSMDYALMDELLKDLKGYDLSPEDRDRVLEMERLLSELNWDGIIQKAGEVK